MARGSAFGLALAAALHKQSVWSPEQIQMVGDSALAGAYLALLDHGSLSEIRRIGQRIRTIELNLDPQFETTSIDQLSLP